MTVAAVVQSVTTRWRLHPPVDVAARYQREDRPTRMFRISIVERTVHHVGGEVDWSVRGVPLTSKGNATGGLDWRSIPDEALASLAQMVEGT